MTEDRFGEAFAAAMSWPSESDFADVMREASRRIARKARTANIAMPRDDSSLEGAMLNELVAMLIAERRGGFDRSATLAKAVEAKRAEGPPSL